MSYQVSSGDISPGILYKVSGEQSLFYNGFPYATGQIFRGVVGIKTFSGIGNSKVIEVAEIRGGVVEYLKNVEENYKFGEYIKLTGFAIEYSLNDAEKKVSDITEIKGFALELIDFPFYSFEVTETRL